MRMPSSVPSMDDHNNLLDRIEVLEATELQRKERHEYKMDPADKVKAAYKFKEGPWYQYIEQELLKFRHDGYFSVEDATTHVFDELKGSFSIDTAISFKNAYRPIRAQVTRLLMRDHPWARPGAREDGKSVTKIQVCKETDPIFWQNDPVGFGWLREWVHQKVQEQKRLEELKRKKAESNGDEG